MEESYFPTQRQRQHCSIDTSVYIYNATEAIVQIGCIIGVLSADSSLCPRTLYFCLIIYTAIECYKFLLLLTHYLLTNYLKATVSAFLVDAGVVSYHCFYHIINIAIAIELYKEPSSIHHSPGILSLIFNIKCFCFITIGVLYCLFIARRSTRTSPKFQPISEDELDTYIASMPEGETCSICYDESNINSQCVILKCKHGFHRNCLKDWLTIKRSCPICRKPVRNV